MGVNRENMENQQFYAFLEPFNSGQGNVNDLNPICNYVNMERTNHGNVHMMGNDYELMRAYVIIKREVEEPRFNEIFER